MELSKLEKKLEIIEKEISKPKLTVASGRISIKIPLDCKENLTIKNFLMKVAEQLEKENFEFTLRGYFIDDQIKMTNGRTGKHHPSPQPKTFTKTFKLVRTDE